MDYEMFWINLFFGCLQCERLVLKSLSRFIFVNKVCTQLYFICFFYYIILPVSEYNECSLIVVFHKQHIACQVEILTYSDSVAGAGNQQETPPTLGLPFPFPCFPGQFRYCLSKRGKPAIEVGAHRFCFNGRAASGKVWWRCSRNPRCRAAVHTFGLRVVQMNSAHTCGVRATPLRPMF